MQHLVNGSYHTVTINNYREIYNGYSVDVLDEVRSAVLDDTDIDQFIEPCKDDAYKLGQFRMARREGVDDRYLNLAFTGKTVYYIRRAKLLDIDITAILLYANKKGVFLKDDVIETLAKNILDGVPVEKVDFKKVPYNLVDGFCRGLSRGFPMWLLIDDVEGCRLTERRLQILLRGMHLGIDVHPFFQGTWSDEQILYLLSIGDSVNRLLGKLNCNFNVEILHEIVPLFQAGVDITPLCVTDSQGYPLYNSFQIYELGQAILSGTATKEMFDCNLSDAQMNAMRLANS